MLLRDLTLPWYHAGAALVTSIPISRFHSSDVPGALQHWTLSVER
jgi:hypothetical protein